MMDGLINLLKPPGPTSHDMVSTLRKLFHEQKIGHTGTLDPGAAGVLPICVGQGTRVVEFLHDDIKKYRAEITFGIDTDTYDAGGIIIRKQACSSLTRAAVKDSLLGLVGEIEQVPPMVSAVHYQGRRLYELARQGVTVERAGRSVSIYNSVLLDFRGGIDFPRAMVDITCSRGTYVRSLCADIGTQLKCGAYLSFLVRLMSGPFGLADSYTFDEIKSLWEQDDHSFLLPVDLALEGMPALTVKEKAVRSVLNGMPLAPSGINGGVGNANLPPLVRLYTPNGCLLAISAYQNQPDGQWLYKPKKVFRLAGENS
jgi:tRNA pseudouridine55 synthase